MKYWSLQRKNIYNSVLAQGIYQPDFSKSEYLSYNRNLSSLYDFILQSYNNINETDLPGLIFPLQKRVVRELKKSETLTR